MRWRLRWPVERNPMSAPREMPANVAEFTRLADPEWFTAIEHVTDAMDALRRTRTLGDSADMVAAMAVQVERQWRDRGDLGDVLA